MLNVCTKLHMMLESAPLKSNRNLVVHVASSSLGDTIKLLKRSADAGNLKLGKSIHAQLMVSPNLNETDSLILSNSLVNLYAKCNQNAIARQLFDEMPKRNLVSWSTLMAAYLHCDFSSQVLGLLKAMTTLDHLSPNEYVLATALSACSECERVDEGRQCHGHALKSGLVFHQYVKNALIHMYSRCFDVDGAVRVFDMDPGADNSSYNSILNGLLDHGYLREAFEIMQRMVGKRVVWDTVSFVSAFILCSRLKDLKLGLQIHAQLMKKNFRCDAYVTCTIIDMYGKCGKLPSARRAFDRFQSQNVVSWTAILAAYFQNGGFEEALNLFLRMEHNNIRPNEYTFAVVLNCCACLPALGLGDLLHVRLWKSGFKDHVIAGNALINMYSKSGSIKSASKVFSSMTYRDSVTWNVMISGFSHHGLGKEALSVFYDLLAAKEHPGYVTFVGVLSACSHLGLVQEGFYYYDELMKQMGIEPGLEHHTCIVSLLSRAGQLDEAEKFMRTKPIKWDVVAWRSLLTACHVKQNYSLGKRIADLVLQVDPSDVGTYTILSNMYAKAKRWDRVVDMRKLMRQRNIKKEPGVSWIEIKNQTHVFAAEDSKHPELSKIHEKAQELLAKIRPLGYVPDITSVLHDVDREQKEDYLVYHSEKLAMAYGIMKTPSDAPIHVIKNLRMCDDCHSAAKFISKVTRRVIIIRDANRFHSFQDGFCTCADYW